MADNNPEENLDDLLCNVLDDMSIEGSKKVEKKPEKPKTLNTNTNSNDLEKLWTAEFTEQFKQYLGGEPGAGDAEAVAASLQRMTESASELLRQAQSVPETPSTEDPVSAVISHTLRNLADNANCLQSPLTEDEIMNMFGTLGLSGDPSNDDTDMYPFMQSMMHSLLSKDILLPALQNIVEKYPAWLAANGSNLPADKLQGYEKQLNLMREVCTELGKESPDDTDVIKASRFDKVLDIMQKMQDCGLPPSELMGELPPETDAAQCSLM